MPPLCNHCGFDNPPGMRFCGNCGKPLIEPSLAQADFPNLAKKPPQRINAQMGTGLLQRFRQAGLDATGQRRNVTVLFADMSGYTRLAERLDSEDLYLLVQRFIGILAENVYRYDGTVDKILGDGVMALFGAPIAHENNSERAVRAALDMLAGVARFSEEMEAKLGEAINVHIGLHAGTVIVGSVGSDLMMDYTAIGDTVNLTQRLEEASQAGCVLVSEKVYRATRAMFEFTAVSNLNLKGIDRQLTAYRLLGLKSQPGSVRGLEGLRAPLIGRENEYRQLIEAVNALTSQNKGQLVLMLGEAGIGKSRLTTELKSHLQGSQLRILEGQSLAYRRSAAYWIFIDLLRNYLGFTPETPPRQVHEQLIAKVYSLLGNEAAETLPYLEHLLSLEHVDVTAGERLAYLEASQLRQQIFIAIRDLLVAESRSQPLMLILEDLHWADDTSLDLLSFLVDSIQEEALFIYAISRLLQEGPLSNLLEEMRRRAPDRLINIHLNKLTADQSDRLLTNLLTFQDFPESLRQRILQRASGIPFYLEEILRMLIDDGVIVRENDRWTLVPGADFSATEVPDTLQGLIMTRFDRLQPFQRKVLQTAAVIGRQFNLSLLTAVINPEQSGSIEKVLNQLIERDFIHLQAGPQHTEYIFRHVLTSEAVYNTLLRRDRSELHGRVAEALEQLYQGQIERHVEVLAGHFLLSPHLDRALHYLALAGQKASRDYANEQARQYFEQVLELLPSVLHTPEQELLVREGLGDVLVFIGEYKEAREQFQSELKVIESAAPGFYTKELSALHRKIGITFERQGDYDRAFDHFKNALQATQASVTPMIYEQARIFNDIGWIHFLQGHFEEAQSQLAKALELVENSKRYDIVASIHNRLGAVAYQQREYELAANHVRKSLVLRETIGDQAGVARLYNNLGLLGLMRGDLRDAETNFEQSIKLLEHLGDAEGIAIAYTNLGLVQLDRGQNESAESNLKNSLQATEQIGHRFYQALAMMYLGRLRTSQEEFKRSDDYLRQSIRIFDELEARDNLIDAYYYLGENYFAQENLEAARLWISQAYETMSMEVYGDDATNSVQRGRVLRLEAAIACKENKFELASCLLNESGQIFDASYERLETARTAYESAVLAQRQGRVMESRQRFQEARLLFQQIGAEQDLHRTNEALRRLTNPER